MGEYEKRGYLLENFRLFHLRTETETKVGYHYHEFCKLVLLVSGKGWYTVDGDRYLLQPGDAVLVGSRSLHKPELEPGCVYERIIIYIDPGFLQRHSAPDCDLAEIFSGHRGHVLRLRETANRKLFALAAELEKELDRDGYGREILSTTALLRLLVQLGKEQRRETQQPQPVNPESPRVRELMAYLDAHLAEDLDIDTLAESFYVSKFHMMRRFREQTGATIHNYLRERRLFFARDLLSQGMASTEVCYRAGFGSYSAFSRAYSKFFGTTPTGRPNNSKTSDESYE
jgi:AraC-like DNA-binding protein